MRARQRRYMPVPRSGLMNLWEEFLRLEGSEHFALPSLRFRTGEGSISGVPFSASNIEHGLVLADALEDNGRLEEARFLHGFIQTIDTKGYSLYEHRTRELFKQAYKLITRYLDSAPSPRDIRIFERRSAKQARDLRSAKQAQNLRRTRR